MLIKQGIEAIKDRFDNSFFKMGFSEFPNSYVVWNFSTYFQVKKPHKAPLINNLIFYDLMLYNSVIDYHVKKYEN